MAGFEMSAEAYQYLESGHRRFWTDDGGAFYRKDEPLSGPIYERLTPIGVGCTAPWLVGWFSLTTKPAEMLSFYPGVNSSDLERTLSRHKDVLSWLNSL
jgi:hypothetical protein